MDCPKCSSPDTIRQKSRTELGYQKYRCRAWSRRFNERTGTEFNFLEYPTDIVLLVLFFRFRYGLSLREVSEIFLLRGFEVSHENIRLWEERFAEQLQDKVRARRHRCGKIGRSWSIDETYIKVNGHWRYLYRAIDRDGNLIDSMLSAGFEA